MTNSQSIGKVLKKRREDLGKKQIDIAAAVGRSNAWVSRIESGVGQVPAALARSMALAYDIPLEDLLTRLEAQP